MTTRLLRLLNVNRKNDWRRSIHNTNVLPAFHEVDKRSTYPRISDYKEEPKNPFQRIKEGYSQLKEELTLFKMEMKEKFLMDPTMCYRLGEVDVQWKFTGDPKQLDDWVVTCDSDYNEGYSKATIKMTPQGTAIFSGTLDTKVPRDGKQARAGYCNVRSVQPRKSFYRDDVLNWGMYTHLILRIRGDGRNYMLNLTLNNQFDLQWNDIHSYVLYTRGGPYWQYVKIPFSKFFLSNRGRIQDSQCPIFLHQVQHLGITCGDTISGSFSLEIDYIGCECDKTFSEEFAYEMYRPPNPYYI